MVRNVKPFVELGVVPFFMDRKLIAETEIAQPTWTRAQTVAFLQRKWMKEKGRGN